MTQNNIIQLPTKESILAELEGLINECEKLEKLGKEIQDLKAQQGQRGNHSVQHKGVKHHDQS
jgi:hypothetical protein